MKECVTHHYACDCRELSTLAVCQQLVQEHQGMRKFTAGLNAKNVKPCKCNGCVSARKLYSDKELGVK